MVEKKSKKSQKNIFEHLIGQVGLMAAKLIMINTAIFFFR